MRSQYHQPSSIQLVSPASGDQNQKQQDAEYLKFWQWSNVLCTGREPGE